MRRRIAAHLPELVAIRRDIHAHPELGFEEVRTPALVAAELRKLGLPVTEGVGRTGVVATLKGRRPGQGAIALRADMDALALREMTGLPYASATEGKMHACGHDGHTTMLLGAARVLAEDPDFAGSVHFVFQPAEEGRGGAQAMLKEGLFSRFPCDAVYGMHNMPGVPVGQFAIRKGAMMAGSGRWVVTFRGQGGHGGNSPHLANDVILAQAMFVQAVQGIVARNVPALESAVVSVGHVAAGSCEALNVMPAELVVGGTMRAFNPPMQQLLDRRIEELARLSAAAQGAEAHVELRWGAVPLVNHDREVEAMVAAAREVSSVDDATRPVTGGEDFAFMLQEKPGAFVFVGTGEGPGLHAAEYDFNDEAIAPGVEFWVRLVRQELRAEG
ncbi:MAG: amidohydrolase [Acetobacteraceae bacterium]|nr:amidohydrolase [Acetobacteraceae bacterium]